MSNLTVQLPTALPSSVQDAGGVSLNGTIFIFNGGQGTILEFNETSETGRVIGDLPFRPGTLPVSSTTAILKGDDSVWLFAGNHESNPFVRHGEKGRDNSIREFHITTDFVCSSSFREEQQSRIPHWGIRKSAGK
jgi:hypothetical protein